MNDLYRKNAKVVGYEERKALLDSPTVLFLLSRGKNATEQWSIDNLFEEKQNDTADILVVEKDFYEIIDVKTRNISKSAQPPNIISSYKLAQLCALMLDNEDFKSFTIHYIEVDWKVDGENLVCENAHHANLFRSHPDKLYINWAAAMQIQFHVRDLPQDFESGKKKWAIEYLRHFVASAEYRTSEMIEKFVKPFEKYIRGESAK